MMDPYATLGIDSNATPEEVRKAFKSKSQIHHPDKNPDDPYATTRFQLIKEAYDILKDPERRARHERGEDPREFDIAGAAMNVLIGVLYGQLQATGERNIIANMRVAVNNRIVELNKASAQISEAADAFDRAKSKFSYSGEGRNFLADAIQDRHQKVLEEITKASRDQDAWRHALKMLDDYADNPDLELPMFVQPQYSTTATPA